MRKDYGKNSRCPICGKYFNYLGLASHRAACSDKKKKELEKNKKVHWLKVDGQEVITEEEL